MITELRSFEWMGSTVRFPKSAAQTTVCSRGGRQIGCAGLRPRTARRWGVTPGACSHLGATPEVALQSGIRNDQKGDQEPRSAAQQELWAAARGGGFHENDRRPRNCRRIAESRGFLAGVLCKTAALAEP